VHRSRLAAALLAGACVLALGGCSSSPQEEYCSTLADQQQTLQKLSAGADRPGRGDLARFIGVFETLRDAAPDDVVDEWDTYLTAWQALESALEEAGADESMFTDGKRPAGMSRQDYRRISQAAADLRSTRVVAAGAGIEQQARDVCKIDLAGSGLSP
jgi:hypothetical protein